MNTTISKNIDNTQTEHTKHTHTHRDASHHVFGINSLLLSINLISASLSLTCFFLLLPHLLPLPTHHSTIHLTSLFHSRLKTHLFHKRFCTIRLSCGLRTDSTDFVTSTFLLMISFFAFNSLHCSFRFSLVPCVRLSWLPVRRMQTWFIA